MIDASSEQYAAVEVEHAPPVRGSVVWLHGLGADGHDFESAVPALELPPDLGVRFVFPHAPYRPVTVNAGAVMRAWYDMRGFDGEAAADETGIREAEARVQAFIRRECARGIAAARIVLAGFSQGAALALHTGLRYPKRLAGVAALSGYLPLREAGAREMNPASVRMPIFLAHGRDDPLIPASAAAAAYDFLLERGFAVEFHLYEAAHAVVAEELRALGRWLAHVLAPG